MKSLVAPIIVGAIIALALSFTGSPQAAVAMLAQTAGAQPLEKVEFFVDSISEKSDSYMRLLGGSSWILSLPSFALVTDDVMIVFRTVQIGNRTPARISIAYLDGDDIMVRHIGGAYATQAGYLTRVVKVYADGAVLELADGTMLEVAEYDRYDTGWWLPPYQALLTGSKLYLYNLKKGKRVWVKPIR